MNLVSAIIAIITALTALVAAVGVLLVNMKATKVSTDVTTMQKDVTHVKVLVNQQKTDQDAYQAVLIAALRKAGLAVPADKSIARD
jgi:hypothetical protein